MVFSLFCRHIINEKVKTNIDRIIISFFYKKELQILPSMPIYSIRATRLRERRTP